MRDLLIYGHGELCCMRVPACVESLVLDVAVLCCNTSQSWFWLKRKTNICRFTTLCLLCLYGKSSSRPDGADTTHHSGVNAKGWMLCASGHSVSSSYLCWIIPAHLMFCRKKLMHQLSVRAQHTSDPSDWILYINPSKTLNNTDSTEIHRLKSKNDSFRPQSVSVETESTNLKSKTASNR